ncbi:MAG: biosynthetic-type acetolactate synthase large subunit [Rhodothermaceae bacterium]|nr:biosynthetic-type acetolactate synthase large subunit [Rhodothermaceae bacterium]MXZ59001.1 biosynthetic-type acetolactate synthase large subunit [Rhodothermaceae bacterium]MYB91910.1 biosynthetic-type acetolactate synthase large subunit [Rhodothermaceae bacterium]MYD67042.1 biosynthetic-type acetolactate synthase large subunit [Rhodothermaceae bacterium]MYG44489.1 biosynthetic-type acetolactate synthase large subunit [Rhodothermaceae bacterium]
MTYDEHTKVQPVTTGDSLPEVRPEITSTSQVMSGAEILLRSLEAEGVKIIFGHPGGAVIKVYDEMHRINPEFQHILVRHEQGGTHAAEGYAKATGKVGTVLVTSGPGATNTVTGIADAYMDSVPIVVFTGQVPTGLIGNDAFQECDAVGITRSITKHSYLVRDIKDLARTVKEAYHIARTGRPGPVLVDLPKDVLLAEGPFQYPETVNMRGYAVPEAVRPEKLQRAARMIADSKRPLLYVGGGAVNSDASESLTELARYTGIPVTTTLHGLGAFPEEDPLALRMLGMHGTWWANQAVQHCDLIIAVGARFDDRVTGKLDSWAPHAKVIHIEIDQSCISKNVFADCAILGDVKTVLERLIPLVDPKDTTEWLEQIDTWRQECPLQYQKDGKLHAQGVIEQLRDKTGGDAVLITDVGQHQMWSAQYFRFLHPRTHITSGGLGTMGFGMPAAMGAAFGMREIGSSRPVVCISGDGGFVMNAQEMSVAAAHKLPLKLAVINNRFLGMVRQWQELFHMERYSHTDLSDTNPDFVKLAEAHHCVGLRANTPEEAKEIIDEAWKVTDRPVLMEFSVAKEEMVFPMVPAGAATGDMITDRMTPNSFV